VRSSHKPNDFAHEGAPHERERPAPCFTLDVLVIGAGQSGLALGYYLQRSGLRFKLIDAAPRLGMTWRGRWESLRLFTPAEFSSLPGMPFPASTSSYPGKDDVADYLQAYARRTDMPVQLGTAVRRLTRRNGIFTATTDNGTIRARQVVIATGPFQTPLIPTLTSGISASVTQLHSATYQRPDDVPSGRVVVGAGNSGVQIAAELAAAGRDVTIAIGSRPRTVPQRPLGKDLFWWLTRTGLIKTPSGTRLAKKFQARELVIGASWRSLRRAGVRLRPRVTGAEGANLRFADGSQQDTEAVLWATGFRPDYDWLDIEGAVIDGKPQHTRGISPTGGLSFLGLPWQHTRGSALLGFVQRDAAWLAEQICACEQRAPDPRGLHAPLDRRASRVTSGGRRVEVQVDAPRS
jgi:putative flavoprotein involved in K+ transport